MVTPARGVLSAVHMCEFASLDRCAAYVAARSALIAVQRVAASWPAGLADRARHGAIGTLQLTAEAVSHDHATPGRRSCLREAITTALGVAAAIDIAHAMGYGGSELIDVQRVAGRTVALLGMLLHASTAVAAHDRKKTGRVSRPPQPQAQTGSRDLTRPPYATQPRPKARP